MTCRRSMSTMGGPMQVVPNIEDEEEGGDKQQSTPPIAPPGTSDFELKLRQATTDANNQLMKERKILVNRKRVAQPPIKRINQDAQPLSPAEALAHRHLLPS